MLQLLMITLQTKSCKKKMVSERRIQTRKYFTGQSRGASLQEYREEMVLKSQFLHTLSRATERPLVSSYVGICIPQNKPNKQSNQNKNHSCKPSIIVVTPLAEASVPGRKDLQNDVFRKFCFRHSYYTSA